jgi:hypothetical protein
MKFKRPDNRERRVVKRFALFPITIYRETRWLETVYIKQSYNIWTAQVFSHWENEEFLTEEDAKRWWESERRDKK